MQEILTAVTYLVTWLICERFIGENGLMKLVISLSAAISVYVLLAVRAHRAKSSEKTVIKNRP